MSDALWTGRALHFVGIGGAGMSGLALVAQSLGASVTGSDRAESSYLARLRQAGVEPVLGHDAANVPPGALVVVSTAISADNPEVTAARAPVIHRGRLLAEVAALKRSICIAGAHGKTTTASMTAHALIGCGRDPAYLIGGELRSTGANAAWGEGEWIVVEADESDRSFLELHPDVAVVTNIELDHHETYPSAADLEGAFAEFAARAGCRVAWRPVELPAPVVSYGIGEGDVSAGGLELLPLGSRFTVAGTRVELRVPGEHNVLNALAALAACREAGVPIAEAAAALGSFGGAGRRFEEHGTTAAGARVFDDYAHHPTEISATLRAARGMSPERLVACFQPHLYSRTAHLAADFGRALGLADLVVVLDVYAARERAEDWPGVSGRLVADAVEGTVVLWVPRMDEAESRLRDELTAGDVLVTLGAGDVHLLAERLTDPAAARP